MTTDLVITNSLLKNFKHCQQATKYQYVDLLGPKVRRSKPLQRGIWFHEMLEAKYKGESVTSVYHANIAKFDKLMDEEKEVLGDLPTEMAELYRAYAWYYNRDTDWKVHEVEIKIEAVLPNGMQGQGKADMLIEDRHGDLWAVDHKTHDRLPGWDYRVLDPQCAYYLWMFRKNDIPVRGFIWNYVVPTPPSPLKFTIETKNQPSRLYKTQPAVMDYPTVERQLTDEQRDMPEVQEILAKLYVARYDRGAPQTSAVFRRDFLEPDEATIDRVIDDICATGERYGGFRDTLARKPLAVVERSVSRSCEWCDYRNLCVAELTGGNVAGIKHREFTSRDPFDYYEVKPNA